MIKMSEKDKKIYRDCIINVRGLNKDHCTLLKDMIEANLNGKIIDINIDIDTEIIKMEEKVSKEYLLKTLKLIENVEYECKVNLVEFVNHRIVLLKTINSCPSCAAKLKKRLENMGIMD